MYTKPKEELQNVEPTTIEHYKSLLAQSEEKRVAETARAERAEKALRENNAELKKIRSLLSSAIELLHETRADIRTRKRAR